MRPFLLKKIPEKKTFTPFKAKKELSNLSKKIVEDIKKRGEAASFTLDFKF